MDEETLNAAMDRYACGDEAAFPILHRALYPRLLAFLTRMSGSSGMADDLVQETFLRMHRARATFVAGGAVLPWAYAIARNVHIDHTRSARLRSTERLPSDPGPDPAFAQRADAESAAIAAETARAVERVLAQIPAAQRDAFVLLRYEGLSVQDAASVLGATPTAVKLRAFRAYEALRAELDELQRKSTGAEPSAANRPKPAPPEKRRKTSAPSAGE
ncbi:MAG: RNA polymerase sigma factor [Polyangiaceae bacterium]|nr:RNA polymerase sigma factor [Polyangiaceae bacterium]